MRGPFRRAEVLHYGKGQRFGFERRCGTPSAVLSLIISILVFFDFDARILRVYLLIFLLLGCVV